MIKVDRRVGLFEPTTAATFSKADPPLILYRSNSVEPRTR
jgi:hypothetical protein